MDIIDEIIKWFLSFFNLKDYNVTEIALFGGGFISWVIAYYYILRDTKKYGICEMPMMMAAANITWEFSWGFLFHSNLGVFFTWGCRAWFLMDIFINRAAYMNGLKLVTNKFLTATFGMWYLVNLIGWFCIVFFMCLDHDDNELGVVSALLINVVMSSLYIYQLLNYPQYRGKGFSIVSGWFKMIGTGCMSAASFILWFDNEFLLSMCVLTFFLDCVYIYLFYQYDPEDFKNVKVAG